MSQTTSEPLEFGEPLPPPRPQSKLVRIGWFLGIGGFIAAFCAVAVMGQGPTPYENVASEAHRLALWTMLTGFVLALIGYRVRWMSEVSRRIKSRSVDSRLGPDDGSAVTSPLADQAPKFGPPAPTAPYRLVPISPDGSRIDQLRQAVRNPTLQVLAFVFGLTILLAVMAVLLLFAPLGVRLFGVSTINVALFFGLLVSAILGRSYLRAFSLAALLPAFALMLLSAPFWSMVIGQGPMFASNGIIVASQLMLVGWITVIPCGVAGIFVLVVFEVLARRDASGRVTRKSQ